MQNTQAQNKEFRTLGAPNIFRTPHIAVQKYKTINELLTGSPKGLGALKAQLRERSRVLEQVCAALPPKLAATVVSAGIDTGRLTVGVASAAWASRLRYVTETLRQQVGASLGVDIRSVKIRVVAPREVPRRA